jgi:NAD(P)-dependent dehydrogenase (short-subunit alcohol dehydrogenase family)
MDHPARVAVVTGGGRGIGEATAKAFLGEGAAVAVFDIERKPPRWIPQYGDSVLYIPCDVSRGKEVMGAVEQVRATFGGVDVLVNNAGIQRYNSVTDTSEEEWDEVMAVNLRSAFLCARYCIPSMILRGRGVIVNLASVQSFVTQAGVAAYTTSKTAILGLTRSIAVDYAPTVRCVAVCPGTVDTPMFRWAISQSANPEEVMRECIAMHPLGRISRPDEIADLILFLASDRASFITGQYVRVDGGLGLSIAGSRR